MGRALARRVDDPAFPELRFARGQRIMLAAAVCAVASLTVSTRYLALKLLLLALGVLIADFPARRRIFAEGWGLFGYLSHTTRVWFGFLGPWLLLALLPALIMASGAAALPAAVGLVALTLVWHHLNARILPRIVRAAPLHVPGPGAELEMVLRQARCPTPRLFRADARDGHWVNAFALPSLQRPAVLFTGGLIEALTPAETRAILAHEVAHLEYFNRRRMLIRALIVAVLAAVPLVAVITFGGESGVVGVMAWVWPLVVLITLVALAARNQALEHESDLRALELVGDPEPLISGLTKVHTLLKMPRRWRARSEGRMSHPSLARRLRAIRDAAVAQGLAADVGVPMTELVVWSVDDASEAVVLDAERLHWLRGVDPAGAEAASALLAAAPDRRSVHYHDLQDLRLEVEGPKRYLTVIDARGTAQKLSIAAADVERVKAALERLDLQVQGTTLEASRRQSRESARQRTARLLGILVCLLAVLPPVSLPFMVTGVLVLARPQRVTLAAAGVIGLAAGVLALSQASGFAFAASTPVLIPIARAVAGALLLWLAVRLARKDDPSAMRVTLVALAALGLVYLITGLVRFGAAPPLMQLHLWVRQQPGLALTLLGLTAALWSAGGRRARVPALALLGLAAAVVFAGSLVFRGAFGDDALAMRQAELVAKSLTADKLLERAVDGQAMALRLAPSGRGHAVQVGYWDEYEYRQQAKSFLVDTGRDRYDELELLDLAFLSDGRIAGLRRGPTGTIHLQVMTADDLTRPTLDLALPEVSEPTLRVDPASDRWEVIDSDFLDGRALLLSGDFNSSDVAESRWSFAEAESSYLSDVQLSAAGGALAVRTHYADQPLAELMTILAPLAGYAATYRLELVGKTRRHEHVTALFPYCAEPAAGDSEFVCAAHDLASGTALWSLDAESGGIRPLGSLRGLYYQVQAVPGGRLLLGGAGLDPLLIDRARGSAWSLEPEAPADDRGEGEERGDPAGDWLARALFGLADWGPSYQAAALRDDVLALAFSSGDSSRIVLYRLASARGRPAAAASGPDPQVQ